MNHTTAHEPHSPSRSSCQKIEFFGAPKSWKSGETELRGNLGTAESHTYVPREGSKLFSNAISRY